MMPAKQDASAPVPAPAVAVAPVPAPAAPATPEKVAAASSLSSKEEILTEKVAQAPVQPAQPAIKTEAKPAPKPEPRPAAAVDDGARAKALLNGQAVAAPAPAAAEGRMVVQVGAFADVAKAREARLKLEKAGLKTYTQVAETKDGKRIRSVWVLLPPRPMLKRPPARSRPLICRLPS